MGQTSFFFTDPFSVFALFLLMLQVTLLLCSLLPLLKVTDSVNAVAPQRIMEYGSVDRWIPFVYW